MAESSKLPPRRPCYAVFNGLRFSKRPGAVWAMHEPVRIVEITNGRNKELAVMMLGRSDKLPLSMFEGEWEMIEGL